jgi:hypothetical protein
MTRNEESLRIYVLDSIENDDGHYASWLPSSHRAWHAVEPGADPAWEPPPDCGLVVTKRHYDWEAVTTLLRLYDDRRVPILILADGILEYRNTWQHPQLVPGSLFQPVIGDKVACYGRSQARTIESWGNTGKCEVVGAPRLDHMLNRRPRTRAAREPFRVLVATARTPGFTDDQTAAVERSLEDLRAWLAGHERVSVGTRDVALEPVWRLTGGLDTALGIGDDLDGAESRSVAEVLTEVDAVITTPSTLILEAMLQGLPVAVLDYTNSPAYVPAAWSISASEHLDQVVPELLEPPAARMLFQSTTLHDALECRSPAADRMVELAEAMITLGESCRAAGRPLEFPRRILPEAGVAPRSPDRLAYDQSLYPDAARRRFLRLRARFLERAVARQRAKIESLEERLNAMSGRRSTGASGRARSTMKRGRDS